LTEYRSTNGCPTTAAHVVSSLSLRLSTDEAAVAMVGLPSQPLDGGGGARRRRGHCLGGSTLCNNACVDTQNDPANCGGCNAPCMNGQLCSMGKCGLVCLGGHHELQRQVHQLRHRPRQLRRLRQGVQPAECDGGLRELDVRRRRLRRRLPRLRWQPA
jgi:hypothetical protein